MQPTAPDEGHPIPSKSAAGAKIPIVPRRDAIGGNDGQDSLGIRLPKLESEGVWDRELRIRPKEPKVPFGGAAKAVSEPQSGAGVSTRSPASRRRPLLSYFRSRRKGRHRIVNYIVLPLAVIVTGVFVLWLLKIL